MDSSNDNQSSKPIVKVSKANTPTSTPSPTPVDINPLTGRHEPNPSRIIDNGFFTKPEELVEEQKGKEGENR